MDTFCTYYRNTTEFLVLIKNTCSLFLLVSGCFISTSAFPADSFLGSITPGYSIGLNYGDAYIDANNFNQYNRASGLFFTGSGFLEKPVSDIFRLSAELHLSSIMETTDGGSSATGAFVALGGKIGRFNSPRAPFFAASIGYSYVDVSNSGERRDPNENDSCVDFICFDFGPGPFRNGGHAKGLGYRIAVGKALSERRRLELSYMNIGGDANGLPDGSTGSMETMNLSVHFLF